jgi:D-arabinose 1-dehydrogenase-like Zn-dependent alcohol dehydrogenase
VKPKLPIIPGHEGAGAMQNQKLCKWGNSCKMLEQTMNEIVFFG